MFGSSGEPEKNYRMGGVEAATFRTNGERFAGISQFAVIARVAVPTDEPVELVHV